MKPSTLMKVAELIAEESKCVSHQVGAIIAKNGRIISTGYNGTYSGATNCCDHAEEQGWIYTRPSGEKTIKQEFREDHSSWSRLHEIHAEQNAISFAARHGLSVLGATMYITLSPCYDCAKLIIQSGIKRVVYRTMYDKNTNDWDKDLINAGVEVIKLDGSTDINTLIRELNQESK